MAKKAIDKDTVKTLTTKNYYSWLTNGEGSTDYVISDKLSSLIFDVGTTTLGTTLPAITLTDGSSNAGVKTIAAGVSYSGAADSTVLAPTSLSINGVDATTVYGGALITTKSGATSVATKYAGTDVTVSGDANIAVTGAKITTVYGGGAGYGSELTGSVKLTFKGSNTIGTVYGGGQNGAVVDGDVSILVDKTDVASGRIGTIYGGGYNAVVNGDVNITIQGVNAMNIGTVSGSGNGSKARVYGTRTLTIADYSGAFKTTIKNFDKIVLESGTAITLTQSQNSSIKSAQYEFVIDDTSVNQPNAMLTWNKQIDVSKFYVTIDSDFASGADDAFKTTIYSSTYLTQAAFDKAGIKVYNADGSEISSGYTLSFVADLDSKGNAKAKGGSIVLTYTGTKSEITADSDDTELTNADDKVTIKGDLVRASVDTKGGDDRVAIQTGTIMAGDLYLGEGKNTVNVQADAEMTGSIVVDKNSTNTINLNGTISQIEGGDATTNNIVNINSNQAVGYFDNQGRVTGKYYDETKGYEVDSLGDEADFVQQDLNFTSGSNDKVVVTTSANYTGNINFGKGADTLVLNTTATGTITTDDGNDVVVANKSGVTIDTTNYRLTGTDDVLVVANGVQATVNGIALGGYTQSNATFARGIYLGQNAIIDVGTDYAVSSYTGDFNLDKNLTILAAKQLDATTDAELISRISDYYTEGTGFNGTIKANNQTVTLKEGAAASGKIYDAAVVFDGNAGGALTFDTATIAVAEDKVATVASIDGLDTTEAAINAEKYYFEDDLAQITLKNDAQVRVTAGTKYGPFGDAAYTVAGPITKSTSFDNVAFTGTIGMTRLASGTVAPVNVTLNDSIVYVASTSTAADDAEFTFNGQNTVDVKSLAGFTLDEQNMHFADGAKAAFNVLDDAKLTFNGVINDMDYTKGGVISVDSIGTNARFFYTNSDTTVPEYGNLKTLETADWDRTLTAADVEQADTVIFREGASIVNGIDLSDLAKTTDVTMTKATVKNDAGKAALQMNGVWANDEGSTLAIADSRIDGEVVITSQNGNAVKGEYATAVTLDNTTVNAVDNGLAVTGDANSMVTLKNATINGELNATATAITSKIGEISGGKTTVVEGKSTIGKFTNGEVIVDGTGAEAEIASIAQDVAGSATSLRVMNGGKLTNAVDMTADTAKLEVIDAEVGTVAQASDAATVKFNYDKTFWAEGAQKTATVYATTAKTGDIAQAGLNEPDAATTATVDASIVKQVKYTDNDGNVTIPFAEAEEGFAADAVTAQTGSVKQTADTNSFTGGVGLGANGAYDTVAGDTNPAKHKVATIDAGAVTASYGSVSQDGTANTVRAAIELAAQGEGDVTVGASTLTLGNVTQYSKNDDGTGANTVNIGLAAVGDSQGVLTLNGDVTGTVGAVKQTTFKGANAVHIGTARYDELENTADPVEGVGYGRIDDEGKKIALEVASISMLAYAGTNTLNLTGNTTVKGDVTVGGVLEGETYKDYAWGDRVATSNTVTMDADTVQVDGTVSLIGLKNTLTLDNNTGASVAIDAAKFNIAGDDNTLDLDAGLTMNKITLGGIADADKIGDEGYDLGTAGAKKNTLTIRGTLNGVEFTQKNSDDTINVYGGTINGDIATQNGTDTINVTGDATAGKATTSTAAKIDGSVTLGLENDLANDVLAAGDKTVTVAAYQVFEDKTGAKQVGVGTADITGSVKMYTDGTNTLTATGAGFTDDMNKYSFARATIGGDVAMEAVKFTKQADGTYAVDTTVGANAATLAGATVGGKIDMAAYTANTLNLGEAGTEEYRLPEAQGGTIDATTKVGGAVTMSGNTNAITAAAFSGNFIAGKVTMDQSYVDADGQTYATSATGTNAITVGAASQGGELLVGTTEAAADVSMGALYYENTAAVAPTVDMTASLAADAGHDAIVLAATTTDKSLVAAKRNMINVNGRFTANTVDMVANTNAISAAGDGTLGKTTVDADGVLTADVAARTSAFTAGAINQAAVEMNTITAKGANAVDVYTDKVVTEKHESVQFTSGAITQTRADIDETKQTYNQVELAGSTVAKTGAITQSGNAVIGTYNAYTNQVTVSGVNSQVVDTANKVAYDQYVANSKIDGNITQTSNAVRTDTYTKEDSLNGVALTQTDVAGTIIQTVTDDVSGNRTTVYGVTSTVTYFDETPAPDSKTYEKVIASTVSGDVEQTGAWNMAWLREAAIGGTVKQTATRGVQADGTTLFTEQFENDVTAIATTTAAAKLTTGTDEQCEVPAGAVDGNNHNAESIKAQAAFNTESIGAISQSFDNTVDADDATAATNKVSLTNVNVGAVTQTGAGAVNNTFTQTAASAITKLATYVGEIDKSEKPVNKTAEFKAVETLTAGDIAQAGTVNATTLTSVKAGTIAQASAQSKQSVGGNTVTLKNTAAVAEAYVDEMSLVAGVETTKKVVLEGSKNDYAKTSVGAITQTSNVQKNYDEAEVNKVISTAAVDTGAITQGLADGTTAKFANVANNVNLMSNTVAYKTLKDVDGNTLKAEAGYNEAVVSTVAGDIAQVGATNTATVMGTISGKVEQSANLIQTEDEHEVITKQEVAAWANTLTVNGTHQAKYTGTIVDEDGNDQTVVVQEEAILNGSVGDVTQTVNDAAAVTGKGYDLNGNNTVNLSAADAGNIAQTTTYGTNAVAIASDALADDTNVLLTAGTITQKGTSNAINGNTVATKAIDQTSTEQADYAANDNAVTLTGSTLDAIVEGEEAAVVVDDPTTWQTIKQQQKIASASAESITQTIAQIADADGNYDSTSILNDVNLADASAGDIVQTGTGHFHNNVDLSGTESYEMAINAETGLAEKVEDSVKRVETLGNVTQTGADDNWVDVDTALKVGDIVQVADPAKVIEKTDDENYTTTVYDPYNEVGLANVDNAGTITQTATSVAYEEVKTIGGVAQDPVATVTWAENDAWIYAATTKDITQTIKDAEGVTGVAEGENYIKARDSNLGNVTQTMVKGENAFFADAGDAEAARTVGTIVQTGTRNLVETGDGAVTTGAITQTAAAVAKDNELENTVILDGSVANVAAGTELTLKEGDDVDPSLPESYEFTQAKYTETKAGDITQIAKPFEFWDADTFEVSKTLDDAQAVQNTLVLIAASAGAVLQEGNGLTTNLLSFVGATVTTKKVEVKNTAAEGEEPVYVASLVDDTTTTPNTIGAVSQKGATNEASFQSGAFVEGAGITQESNTFKMTYENNDAVDGEGNPAPESTTTIYTGALDNVAEVSNMTTVGDVSQTVNGQEAVKRVYVGNGLGEGDMTTVYANGTNEFTATASTVGAITQVGGTTNKATLSEATSGAISQTAALYGTEGKLFNGAYASDSTVASITQVANGEYKTTTEEVEGVEVTKVVKNTSGHNVANVASTDVTGAITQTAAGASDFAGTYNKVIADGKVTETTFTAFDPAKSEAPTAENPDTFKNGTFDNTIGSISQTVTSFADADMATSVFNSIELTNINAGALEQTAVGYATNIVTTPKDTGSNAVLDQYAKDAENEYKAVAAAPLKAQIASIDQTGYQNQVTLTDVTVGDITLDANKVESETGAQIGLSNKTLNTVTLTGVDAGDIEATAAANTATVLAKDGTIKVEVAMTASANITLSGSTATGITTGNGNDVITLDGKTAITGDINMGGETVTLTETIPGQEWVISANGADKLVIGDKDGASVDLSAATIKNVETIETHGIGNTLNVAGLVSDSITLDADIKTISATTLDLGAVNSTAVTTITAQADADKKLTAAVDYTFTDGLGDNVATITGSKTATDAITFGDGAIGIGDDGTAGTADDVYATFDGLTLTGFETVEINKDAVLTDVTWKKTAADDYGKDEKASDTIAFTFETGTIGKTGYYIGDLTDYAGGTVKLGGETLTQGASTWDSKSYSYNKSTGVVTYIA